MEFAVTVPFFCAMIGSWKALSCHALESSWFKQGVDGGSGGRGPRLFRAVVSEVCDFGLEPSGPCGVVVVPGASDVRPPQGRIWELSVSLQCEVLQASSFFFLESW